MLPFRYSKVELAVVGDAGVGKSCLVERFAVRNCVCRVPFVMTMPFEVAVNLTEA